MTALPADILVYTKLYGECVTDSTGLAPAVTCANGEEAVTTAHRAKDLPLVAEDR